MTKITKAWQTPRTSVSPLFLYKDTVSSGAYFSGFQIFFLYFNARRVQVHPVKADRLIGLFNEHFDGAFAVIFHWSRMAIITKRYEGVCGVQAV